MINLPLMAAAVKVAVKAAAMTVLDVALIVAAVEVAVKAAAMKVLDVAVIAAVVEVLEVTVVASYLATKIAIPNISYSYSNDKFTCYGDCGGRSSKNWASFVVPFGDVRQSHHRHGLEHARHSRSNQAR